MTRTFTALVAAGLLWGLTVPLSKVALGWLDPAWLVVVRFALAAPVLAFLVRRTLRESVSAPIVAWGILGYGGVVLLQNLGIERTSVSHAALIIGAVPVFVALATAARGRSTAGPLAWAGFTVALGGVGLVAGGGGDASLAGDAIVLASAAVSALFIEAQSRLLPGRDPVAVTAVQLGASAAAVLPFALAFGTAPALSAGGGELAAVAALGAAGTLVPFALYAWAQARVTAEVAGAFVNVEPLVGVLVGALAFQDSFGAAQVLGAAAIAAGILLSARPSREPVPA